MANRRLVLSIPAAVLVVGVLSGCLDGTVRSPSEASGNRHARGQRHGHQDQQGGKHRQQSGDSEDEGDVVTFAAVGDTAMGVTPNLPAEPATYFDPIKGELKGDVVFGNLEGTLTDVSKSPKCGEGSSECFAFRAPPEYAKYLRGMEIYRDRLIADSLGNFSGFHNFTLEGVLGETVVLHVTVAEDGSFRAGRLASVSLIEEGQPVPDPEGAAGDLVAALSKEDFGSHGVEISSSGRVTP